MLHVQLNAKETSSKTNRTGYKPVRSLRIELAAVVGTDCFFFRNIVNRQRESLREKERDAHTSKRDSERVLLPRGQRYTTVINARINQVQ